MSPRRWTSDAWWDWRDVGATEGTQAGCCPAGRNNQPCTLDGRIKPHAFIQAPVLPLAPVPPRPRRGGPLALGRSEARGRRAQGRGDQVHLRPEQDLPRHGARLLGLCAQAVRPGPAGVRVRQPGRRAVQRPGRLRHPHPQEGNAGRHRRLCPARTGGGPVGQGAGPLQPQLRVRRPGRQLRPLPVGGTAARGREEDHRGRPPHPAVSRRQRPLHRRHQQRRHLRLHGGVGAARRLPPGLQRHRHLRRPARRRGLPDLDPQGRAQADPRLPPGRQR